jgi:hypothetical protein
LNKLTLKTTNNQQNLQNLQKHVRDRSSGHDITHHISDRSPGPCFEPHEPSRTTHSIAIKFNLILYSDLLTTVEQDVFYRSFLTKHPHAFHASK